MNIKTMILFCKNITLYCALKCMNSSALSYSQILLNDEDELPAWYPWEGPARATQASPEGETGINVFCERVMSINFVPPPGADVHSERHSVQTLNIKRLLSQSSHPSISGILSPTCNRDRECLTKTARVGAENDSVTAMQLGVMEEGGLYGSRAEDNT